MTLQIFDTRTREKKPFNPLQSGKVGLYVCGVTVYDLCHIGHARTYISFDVVVRYLRYLGYEVNYVRNITDIDDKIITKSQAENKPYAEITETVIQAMHEDFAGLRLTPPNSEPRATEYVPKMVAFIEGLLAKELAYASDNGDVYYAVEKFADYGQLAHRKLSDMQAGARVDVNEAKRHPADFVLWKAAKAGEPAWESPWGQGRPGWHLECSVMAMDLLGETFDIHGGGVDLVFPHHEDECAQSEGLTNKRFVNTWMHAGFLQINAEKMAKSLGNFKTIREVLQTVHHEVLRYFMISGHYRSPLDYSVEQMALGESAVARLYQAIRDVPEISEAEFKHQNNEELKIYEQRFQVAMNDDFNTPEALAVLFELAREVNKQKLTATNNAQQHVYLLRKLSNILGLLSGSAESFFQDSKNIDAEQVQKIENLIEQRSAARNAKDWAVADKIRNELTAMKIVLEDSKHGTTWRKA